MCIGAFIWQAHPLHPFILVLNRDEYYSRPTIPLCWWQNQPEILAGRDAVSGGTWLGASRHGKIAFLTNVRELSSSSSASRSQYKHQLQPKSRGHLPLRFLQSQKSPEEFADELVEEGEQYDGFNLIAADLSSMAMSYITNRPKSDGITATPVSPGIHVLSNAKLDTPWPKAQRLEQSFKSFMDRYGDGEVPLKELCQEVIMEDTTKDDESKLPHICPLEWEYQSSSIFVDAESPMGRYGTRSTSTLVAKTNGEVTFSEKYLDKDSWKERIVSFHIGFGFGIGT